MLSPTTRTPVGDVLRESLLDVYRKLLDHFGPRHWWPADTPFEVIVGAILTQQVAWRNVEKAIKNLKEAECLSPQGILNLPEERLHDLIRPTRYYKQKAARLRDFSMMVVRDFAGDLGRLFALPIADLRRRLLSLKGVGEETADSIILYAAGKPIFVIDNYTIRIVTRLGWRTGKTNYGELQEWFMTRLPEDTQLFNEYHALIDGLGHHICLKEQPRCEECPLAIVCLFPLKPKEA